MSQPTKSERTASRIATAAAELFFAQGFAPTTIAQVAAQSDVAVGTVMLHFGSKSELATAAFADRVSEVVRSSVESLDTTSQQILAEDLCSFVRPIYEWYRAHADVAPDLLREALFAKGPWAAHYGETVAATIAAFGAITQRHGVGEPGDQVIAEGLLADYLLVLLRGFRGEFATVDDQVNRFEALAATRFPKI